MADMAGQNLPRIVLGAVLLVAVGGLIALGVMYRLTDPAAPSGAPGEVSIPDVPDAEQAPPVGTDAFERPLFHRTREPGPDGPPAFTEPSSDPDTSGAAPGTVRRAADPSQFTLQGIIVGERGARAAVRGATATGPTWVKRGDEVDGWTVESITADIVRLRKGDQVAELKFSRDE
jgi:hypothetical protein